MDRIPTKKLVFMAFLTALSVILTRLLSVHISFGGVEGIRIGIGGLPIIFSGIMFGPVAGGIVGAVADVIGYLLNPMGPYMPHFTFTAFLTGFIPGIMICYLFRRKLNYFTLLVSIGTGQLISSVILVPIFLENLFGVPLVGTLPPRIITQLINIPLYSYLVLVLCRYELFSAQAIECGDSFKSPCL